MFYTIYWPIPVEVLVRVKYPMAGHAEGAILSCRMVILPSDAISAEKSAAARVVTCVCLQCTWRVLFCYVA